jgi:hypothetical protein
MEWAALAAPAWAAVAALIATALSIGELLHNLFTREPEPVYTSGRVWRKSVITIGRRVFPDFASAILAFLVVSPGAEFRSEIADAFGLSETAITAAMAGVLGPVLLRYRELWGPLIHEYQVRQDKSIAYRCLLEETHWRRDEVLPALLKLPPQDFEDYVLTVLQGNLSGEELAAVEEFVRQTLTGVTPNEKAQALGAVVRRIEKTEGGRDLIYDLTKRGRPGRRKGRISGSLVAGLLALVGTFAAQWASLPDNPSRARTSALVGGSLALGLLAGFTTWLAWPRTRRRRPTPSRTTQRRTANPQPAEDDK